MVSLVGLKNRNASDTEYVCHHMCYCFMMHLVYGGIDMITVAIDRNEY